MIEINPREVASEGLYRIFEEQSFNNVVLKSILKQNGAMAKNDKAFVTEIVNGTLRNIYYIDYVINQFSNTKTDKIKPWLLAVMRSAVYQIIFMDKVPVSASCNEAVKLAKKRGYGKLSGFVNGVLRSISRNVDNIELPKYGTPEYLNIKYSHPLWLIKMWLHEYDYDFVENLCKSNNEPPDVTVVVNTLKTDRDSLKNDLEKEDIVVSLGKYHQNVLHLKKTSDISNLDAFKKGLFHIQDESSVTAVKVLDPKKGEKILDICSAPGGKSMLSAELMENLGEISSRDIYYHKIELIEDSSKRLGLSIINAEEKDALQFYPEDVEKFDRVLVDAPCSGFGIIKKKPDIKFRRTGNDIDELIKIQRGILENASKYVKKGGVLVYSTCTICKKENIKNVQWFLENFDFELEDIDNLLPNGVNSQTKGCVSFYPNVNGTDGFFIARFRRKEN